MATIPADHLKLIFSFVTKNSFALFAPVCRRWRTAFGDDVLTDPAVAMEGDLYTINADLFKNKLTIARYWNASCHIQALLDYFPERKADKLAFQLFAKCGNIDAIKHFSTCKDMDRFVEWYSEDISINSSGHIPVIKWLLDVKPDSESILRDILFSAAKNGRMDAIDFLINLFDDDDEKIFDDDSAVGGAIAGGRLDIISKLDEMGFESPYSGDCQEYALDSNNVEFIKLYIDDDEEFTDSRITDLLERCARENAGKAFEFLFERYPEQVKKRNIYVKSIEEAICHDSTDYIDALARSGLKLQLENYNQSWELAYDSRTYSCVLGHLYAQDVRKRQREDGDDNYTRKRQRANDSDSD